MIDSKKISLGYLSQNRPVRRYKKMFNPQYQIENHFASFVEGNGLGVCGHFR